MWTIQLGRKLREPIRAHEVAALMAGLKLVRMKTSPGHADNWVDGAGYLACGAGIIAQEQEDET